MFVNLALQPDQRHPYMKIWDILAMPHIARHGMDQRAMACGATSSVTFRSPRQQVRLTFLSKNQRSALIVRPCPTVLLVVAIATFIVRYKGRSGRLVQVMRRDGGVYYIALAG